MTEVNKNMTGEASSQPTSTVFEQQLQALKISKRQFLGGESAYPSTPLGAPGQDRYRWISPIPTIQSKSRCIRPRNLYQWTRDQLTIASTPAVAPEQLQTPCPAQTAESTQTLLCSSRDNCTELTPAALQKSTMTSSELIGGSEPATFDTCQLHVPCWTKQTVLEGLYTHNQEESAPGVCFCLREPRLILCRSCGNVQSGRVRKKCQLHPTQVFLMDFLSCSSCDSQNLKEISSLLSSTK